MKPPKCQWCEWDCQTCVICGKGLDIIQPHTDIFAPIHIGAHRFADLLEVDQYYYLDDVAYSEDFLEESIDKNLCNNYPENNNKMSRNILLITIFAVLAEFVLISILCYFR